MNLLDGSEERMVRTKEENKEKEEKEEEKKKEEEEDISKEEIIIQETKKALGENGIENEAWRLMPREIGEVLIELIKKIWRERGISAEWNRGIISPIYKKGEKSKTKNYRGVTLMDIRRTKSTQIF